MWHYDVSTVTFINSSWWITCVANVERHRGVNLIASVSEQDINLHWTCVWLKQYEFIGSSIETGDSDGDKNVLGRPVFIFNRRSKTPKKKTGIRDTLVFCEIRIHTAKFEVSWIKWIWNLNIILKSWSMPRRYFLKHVISSASCIWTFKV